MVQHSAREDCVEALVERIDVEEIALQEAHVPDPEPAGHARAVGEAATAEIERQHRGGGVLASRQERLVAGPAARDEHLLDGAAVDPVRVRPGKRLREPEVGTGGKREPARVGVLLVLRPHRPRGRVPDRGERRELAGNPELFARTVQGMAKEVRHRRRPPFRIDRREPVRAGQRARRAIEGHEQQVGGERVRIDGAARGEGPVEPGGGRGEKRLLLRARVPRVLVVEALDRDSGGDPPLGPGRPRGGFGLARGRPLPQAAGPRRGQQALELRVEVDDLAEIVEEQRAARREEARHRRAVVRGWSVDPQLRGGGGAEVRPHPRLDEQAPYVGRGLDGKHRAQHASQRFPDFRRPALPGTRRAGEGGPVLPEGALPVPRPFEGPPEVQAELRILPVPVARGPKACRRLRRPAEAEQDEAMVEPVVGRPAIEGEGAVMRAEGRFEIALALQHRPEVRVEHRAPGPERDRALKPCAGLGEVPRFEGGHRVQVPGVGVAGLALQHRAAGPFGAARIAGAKVLGDPGDGGRLVPAARAAAPSSPRPPGRGRRTTALQRAAPYLRRAAPRTR